MRVNNTLLSGTFLAALGSHILAIAVDAHVVGAVLQLVPSILIYLPDTATVVAAILVYHSTATVTGKARNGLSTPVLLGYLTHPPVVASYLVVTSEYVCHV